MSLPKGWVRATLKDIGKWGSGGTPKKTEPKFYDGNIPWVKIGDLNNGYIYNSETYITELGLKNSSAKLISSDVVLIAMYGASIGKLGITKIECCTNQAIAFCKTDNQVMDRKYLLS